MKNHTVQKKSLLHDFQRKSKLFKKPICCLKKEHNHQIKSKLYKKQ